MPNWCYTDIMISHPDTEKVQELYFKLQEWTSRDAAENRFGHNGLGNIVLSSGIGTVDTGNPTDFRCRGTVCSLDIDGGCIHISTETAWCPMLRMWQAVVDKYLPGADVIFTAEEPGLEIYESNDPDVIGTFVLDIYEDEVAGGGFEEGYHILGQSELLGYLRWLFFTNETGKELLRGKWSRDMYPLYESENEDGQFRMMMKAVEETEIEGLSIHMFEAAEISDFD